ncbi:hypothetical protein SLITK23_75600 [Streptomyces lividans]|uniref:Uncharacterized protein n=1 Tax=Streptomyces lividans 1326 TaxID=1200984 RepID=A0A7U9E3Q1_STRLI|nr:hypothetical protein SLI_8093 [Streptomyces lividans 1326]KKD14048.1 hypothetical protein TR66_17265 [Streptomyces sp. WM6391]BDE44315.1 hypothetical protein SLITK23_75600 [Streptomyces lividans]
MRSEPSAVEYGDAPAGSRERPGLLETGVFVLGAHRAASASETQGVRMRVKPGRPCIAITATQ